MELILDVIITGLIQGAIFGLIAAGLNLQYGVARVLNVAHGEFVMVGAFITYLLVTWLKINPLFAIVIFSPFVFLGGMVLYKVIFQYIRNSSESTDVFEGRSMLASFGLLYVIQNLALLWWGTETTAYSFLATSLHFLGVTLVANRVLALFVGLGTMIVFYLFLKKTRLGKAIRAAAENPTAARLSGINVNLVLGVCFGLGAFLACMAGALVSTMSEIRANMGFSYLVIALVVVVLGGLGNILGSFVGGLILGVVTTAVMFWEPELTYIASYLIFTLVLIFRPQGLFGKSA